MTSPSPQQSSPSQGEARMNPEVKARWVAALRSGEYAQGKEYLRSVDEKFCCLGVLCDLHAKDVGGGWGRLNGLGEAYFYGDGGSGTLEADVIKWAGLKSHLGGDVSIDGAYANLPTHNDEGGASFAEIADAIEAQL